MSTVSVSANKESNQRKPVTPGPNLRKRGFSLMNILKYWLTNRMRVSLVSDIMMIKNAKWTVQYVIEKWSTSITDKFEKIKDRKGPRDNYVKKKSKDKKRKR